MASLGDRFDYETTGLERADLADEPIEQWWRWYARAEEAGCTEPQAVTLSTVGPSGEPDARIVLVRDVDRRGFSFFTNFDSDKSRQLTEHPVAALTFSWLELHRQVRVRGNAERVDDDEADAYFASRPRSSQVGAWASPQSQILRDRDELDALVAAALDRFAGGTVPRPPHWGGWRIVPHTVEFWQGRPSRLHDRFRYRRSNGDWLISRLAP